MNEPMGHKPDHFATGSKPSQSAKRVKSSKYGTSQKDGYYSLRIKEATNLNESNGRRGQRATTLRTHDKRNRTIDVGEDTFDTHTTHWLKQTVTLSKLFS